jgi:hypothetical protein
MGVLGRRIAEKGRDLDRRRGFDAFASGHGEGSSFVRPGDAPRAFCAIAADSFGGAKSFVSKFRIANPSISNGEKHLASDPEYVEFVMRKRGCVLHGFGPFAPSKDRSHAEPPTPPNSPESNL